MSPYYFYFARYSDNSLYSGTTTNLKERERRHNAGRGARYTARKGPVAIVYLKAFETLRAARRREAEVKRWPKAKKEELIRQHARTARLFRNSPDRAGGRPSGAELR